jgi:ATP-dependent 26S proteasome regulatory subunit
MQTHFLRERPKIVISPRYRQVISLHVLKNMLKQVKVQVPLLLGVHGPSGEGKTFQLEYILRNMGVKRYLISGGQLESEEAGESAHIVRSTYLKAGDAIRSGEYSATVMLINDIDTGLSPSGGADYTPHQKAVFGELMHLVDYPTNVEGKDTERVPVIITGNDFTKLYEPLMRAGRMTAFEWIPNMEERVEILTNIYPELSDEECTRLILELNRACEAYLPASMKVLPVAFFAHLRSSLLDEDLWEVIQMDGLENTIINILKGEEPDLTYGITYDRIFNKGVELAKSGRLVNHLRPNANG